MKSDLLVWNVQGAVSRSFPRVMREYMCDLNPNMVVLIETRVSGAIVNRVISNLGMPKSHKVEAREFSGGIWVLWKESVEVQVLVNSRKFVHLKVKFLALTDWVLFTGVYGSLRDSLRRQL